MLPFGRMVQYGNIKPTVQIKDVIIGDYSMFVLYNNGKLFGRGYNISGELGLGNQSLKQDKWYELPISNVKEVHAGTTCSIIKTEDNKIYYAGWHASLGFSGAGNYNNFEDKTSLFSQFDISTVQIIPASRGIFALQNGELFAIGQGTNASVDRYGNVGVGTNNSTTFKKVSKAGEVVKKVFSTVGSYSEASFYITGDNKLFSTGRNINGTCGLGYAGETPTFAQVTLPETPRTVLLSNGSGVIITNEGSMYCTGSASQGRVGNGVTSNTMYLNPVKNNVVQPEFVNSIIESNHTFFSDYSMFAKGIDTQYACGPDYHGWVGVGIKTGTYPTFTAANKTVDFTDFKYISGQYSTVFYKGNEIYMCGRMTEIFGTGTPDNLVFTLIPSPSPF